MIPVSTFSPLFFSGLPVGSRRCARFEIRGRHDCANLAAHLRRTCGAVGRQGLAGEVGGSVVDVWVGALCRDVPTMVPTLLVSTRPTIVLGRSLVNPCCKPTYLLLAGHDLVCLLCPVYKFGS
jgi:hypothetical protein